MVQPLLVTSVTPTPPLHYVTKNDTAHLVLYCVISLHCITFRNEFRLLKLCIALRKNDTFSVISCFISFRFLSWVSEIVLTRAKREEQEQRATKKQTFFNLRLLIVPLKFQKFLYSFYRQFLDKKCCSFYHFLRWKLCANYTPANIAFCRYMALNLHLNLYPLKCLNLPHLAIYSV